MSGPTTARERTPRRRDDEATITLTDNATPLGRYRVRAWLAPPRPGRPARVDVRLADVAWAGGRPRGGRRVALRFADGHALLGEIDPSGAGGAFVLRGILGPGGQRLL